MGFSNNKAALLGTILCFCVVLGHLSIIDIPVSLLDRMDITPSRDFISQMQQHTVDFGWMGENTVYRLFAGFSLFIPILFLILGLYNWMLFKSLSFQNPLRLFSIKLSFFMFLVMQIMADIFFIYPPMVGGVLGIIFWGLAWRKEN